MLVSDILNAYQQVCQFQPLRPSRSTARRTGDAWIATMCRGRSWRPLGAGRSGPGLSGIAALFRWLSPTVRWWLVAARTPRWWLAGSYAGKDCSVGQDCGGYTFLGTDWHPDIPDNYNLTGKYYNGYTWHGVDWQTDNLTGKQLPWPHLPRRCLSPKHLEQLRPHWQALPGLRLPRH